MNSSIMTQFIPREKAVNTFKALQLASPPTDHNYCVVAYFLTEEKADNGCQGLWMCLGCYKDSDKAVERAQELIEITGHHSIFACSTCSWEELNEEVNTNRTKVIPVHLNERLDKQMEKERKRIEKLQEKEQLIRQEIDDEIKEESDENSMAYYIRQWYVAIKNVISMEYHRKQLEEMTEAYNKRIENIKTSENNHPEYKKDWLPTLVGQYKRRSEEKFIPMTLTGFKKILEKEGWSLDNYNDPNKKEESTQEEQFEVKKPIYTDLYDSGSDGEEPEEDR